MMEHSPQIVLFVGSIFRELIWQARLESRMFLDTFAKQFLIWKEKLTNSWKSKSIILVGWQKFGREIQTTTKKGGAAAGGRRIRILPGKSLEKNKQRAAAQRGGRGAGKASQMPRPSNVTPPNPHLWFNPWSYWLNQTLQLSILTWMTLGLQDISYAGQMARPSKLSQFPSRIQPLMIFFSLTESGRNQKKIRKKSSRGAGKRQMPKPSNVTSQNSTHSHLGSNP